MKQKSQEIHKNWSNFQIKNFLNLIIINLENKSVSKKIYLKIEIIWELNFIDNLIS